MSPAARAGATSSRYTFACDVSGSSIIAMSASATASAGPRGRRLPRSRSSPSFSLRATAPLLERRPSVGLDAAARPLLGAGGGRAGPAGPFLDAAIAAGKCDASGTRQLHDAEVPQAPE